MTAAPPTTTKGRLIGGRYRLAGEIARGPRGAVWHAEDEVLRRRVALKVLDGGDARAAGPQTGVVARLSHPNVVRVYDGGVDDGHAFTVMELLEGEDLARRLARVGRLSLGALLPLLSQAAVGLDAAHAAGLVHGGLKPSHLFLARAEGGEAVKILDLDANGSDPSDDVHALAAIAWLALTGRGDGSDAPPMSEASPTLTPDVDAFFARALARDPAARFRAARELVDAVRVLCDAAGATRTTRILVVDDEPDSETLIRQLFRRHVRRGTYDFVFAPNGLVALEILDEHPEIDVVLSDINMPEMDGLTFLEKARAKSPHRRVVMVSAYGDMQNIRTAMNRGAFDFVTKPIDLADLEATIHKAVLEVGTQREALRRWADAERARKNLARYFAPTMVDLLAASDAPMRTARRAQVGVIFADIVGFTRYAESVDPEEVLALLREFHDRMEGVVFQHRGTLEKYIGDALLATFGVPTASGRDATLALVCARAMLDALGELNQARIARGEAPIRMGIGVHFGPVVLGDIGEDRNAAFVVIGDTVNTGSRLQTASRELGATLVASQDLLSAVAAESSEDHAPLLGGLVDLGERVLRGRQRPIRLWALRADAPSEPDSEDERVLAE